MCFIWEDKTLQQKGVFHVHVAPGNMCQAETLITATETRLLLYRVCTAGLNEWHIFPIDTYYRFVPT